VKFRLDESLTFTDKQISEIKSELDVSDSLNDLISLGLITMEINTNGDQVFKIVEEHREFLELLVT